MKSLQDRSLFMPKNPLIIKKERLYSLSDCLNALSKKQLLIITDEIMPISFKTKNHTKAVLVPALQTEIQRRVLYAFKYLYPFVSAFFVGFVFKEKLSDILKNFKELEQISLPQEHMQIIAAQILMENGFCFAFLPKGKRTVQYVIPNELQPVAEQMLNTVSSVETQPIARNDLMLYANVLTSLYGICSVDLFMSIYNRDTIHTITDKQAFLWAMEEAAAISGNCYFVEDSVVSNHIFHEKYEDQKQILEETRGEFEPYIPSEEEIVNKFFLPFYDADLEAYKQCVECLAQYLPNRDAVEWAESMVENLCSCIKLDFSIDEQLEVLDPHYNVLPQLSRDDQKQFGYLLGALNTGCRRWTLWGHTPCEVSEDDEMNAQTINKDEKTEDRGELPHFRADQPDDIPNKQCAALPAGSCIPSEADCEAMLALFDEYCTAGDEVPWDSIRSAQMKRIASSYKKVLSMFEDFLKESMEDTVEELIGQWLASIWHKMANRGGTFGNQQWNYVAFRVLERLAENVFSCEGEDGRIFVVYSIALEEMTEPYITCMSVLVDMGGWYLPCGPFLLWRRLFLFDIIALAKQVAPQMYKEQGLSAVIQFNPCPFWTLLILGPVPVTASKNTIAIECSLECRFKNNMPPELPKSWLMEKSGNYTRWIYNKNDDFNSRELYYNHKTHEVFVYAHNEEAFQKLLKTLKKYIDVGENEITKTSLLLATFCESILKYPNKHTQLEKKFKK